MKCIACSVEVPTNYKHSINSNVCPNCGNSIYDDSTKDLIEEMRAALTTMDPISPEELVAWLMSNYKLLKIGSAAPVEFSSPKKKIVREKLDGEDFVVLENKSTVPTSKFFKNAGLDDKKQKELANIAKKLKSGELTSNSMDISDFDMEDDESDLYDNDGSDDIDPQALNTLSKLTGGQIQDDGGESYKKMMKLKTLRSKNNFNSGTGAFKR